MSDDLTTIPAAELTTALGDYATKSAVSDAAAATLAAAKDMARIYARLVSEGARTLESIPERWRSEVAALLGITEEPAE